MESLKKKRYSGFLRDLSRMLWGATNLPYVCIELERTSLVLDKPVKVSSPKLMELYLSKFKNIQVITFFHTFYAKHSFPCLFYICKTD